MDGIVLFSSVILFVLFVLLHHIHNCNRCISYLRSIFKNRPLFEINEWSTGSEFSRLYLRFNESGEYVEFKIYHLRRIKSVEIKVKNRIHIIGDTFSNNNVLTCFSYLFAKRRYNFRMPEMVEWCTAPKNCIEYSLYELNSIRRLQYLGFLLANEVPHVVLTNDTLVMDRINFESNLLPLIVEDKLLF